MSHDAGPHSAGLYRAAMFDAGAWLARIFPLAFLRAWAGAAGWLYALTHPARVDVVEQNLRLLDRSLTYDSARRVYAEFGKTLADYFHIGTRAPEKAARLITRIDGLENLRAAQASGRGVLIVTAHFGLFELGALLLTQHGFPAVVLTYPEQSRALTEWRAAFRQRWGAGTVEIGADSFAFLQIAALLREGKFVCTLVDRPHPTDSTPVQLPAGTANFSTGILLLAASAGVPVVPATMVRRADGGYHAQVFAPLLIEDRGSRVETLRHHSQRLADTFAPVLCAHPEQWYQFVPLTSAPPKT